MGCLMFLASCLLFAACLTITGAASDVSDIFTSHQRHDLAHEDSGTSRDHHSDVLHFDVAKGPTSRDVRDPNDGIVQFDVDSRSYASQRQQHDSDFDKRVTCGDGYCRCNGSKADCSDTNGNLTFVPTLPQGIRFLNFSGNKLSVIDCDDFFHNVTNITGIDLGNNGLTKVSPGVFTELKQLKFLYLGFNNLTYETLSPALSVTGLKYLGIPNNGLGPIPRDLFHQFQLPYLDGLFLDDNHIWTMNFSTLLPLRNLKVLLLANNQIAHGLYTDRMENLEKMSLLSNDLVQFPQTCRNGVSLFPSLKQLNLKDNELKTLPSEICLPKLELLQLSTNKISTLTTGMFSQTRFNNWHVLSDQV